jgi:hypothetical protein
MYIRIMPQVRTCVINMVNSAKIKKFLAKLHIKVKPKRNTFLVLKTMKP